MAAIEFKMQIVWGADPSAQYAAIATKDQYTFYLLTNGYGYLGNVPLFNGNKQDLKVMDGGTLATPEVNKLYVLTGVTYNSETLTGLYFYSGSAMVNYGEQIFSTYLTSKIIKTMTAEGYTGDDGTIPSTKAVVDLVNKALSENTVLTAKFFRKVESHVITSEDLSNVNISIPDGVVAGDKGLLFTADNDGVDGNESWYYISLKDYIKIYDRVDTNSIKMGLDETGKFSATLNLATGENSIVVDSTGVYLSKTDVVNEETPSASKLVTESAMVTYVHDSVLTAVNAAVTEALQNKVTYSVNPPET